ncbi:tripartite tricarboxylate transporter substrate binding protein [Variovorax sp. Sphag1AA]|uniref:Bug family tripartite tricarboxylate transporter substrate binding protein n=1 Tax=Variovorax sp. Sphag1AA TaxID=2587027 RepID=UPI0016170D0E|nr:tripartite tricarboxylate transporter substrate binding protein [Variovorax sp. Sphag1AA]MBB3178741.1 tripartite-type tricarboxylate transporter receptor subunit TctC [Variovorax sp. Sphag1AA]
MTHRAFLTQRARCLATALAVAAFSGAASAQAWPERPIRMIVPAAAGGMTDISARVVAKRLGQELGQPVVVENKGGGGGRIGAAEVAHSKPDGYTVLFANAVTQALLPATVRNMNYDPLKDFTQLGLLFDYTTVLVCNKSLPFDDIAGFIAYAKKVPGKPTMATAGPGSGNHFTNELFNMMAGVQTLSVHYRGNAPALQDVLAGVADCSHQGEVKQYVDSGKLKLIATDGRQRDPRFPQLKTVAESGLPGYELTWWQGLTMPAGAPPEVVAKLVQALRTVADDPDVRMSVRDYGLAPAYGAPAAMEQTIRRDMTQFRRIAAQSEIVIE